MASVLVPPFPLLGEPGEWPALVLVSATVFLEAEGEPWDGLLGVGWVVRRRALDWKLSWHAAILGPDAKAEGDARPFEPFSCWGDSDLPHSRARLAGATPEKAEPSWRAAAAALWGLLPDPVDGATHYLNESLTKKIRGGTLPAWAALPTDSTLLNPALVRTRIGRHVFLKA